VLHYRSQRVPSPEATAFAEEEPAQRPVRQARLTVIGVALESAPRELFLYACHVEYAGLDC
jgi:hypothetical protein